MIHSIKDILYVLKYFKKENISLLVILMLLVSFLELVGVSLIFPFITSLLGQELSENIFFNFINSNLSFVDLKNISVFLILIVLIFYILKNFFIIYVVSKQTRYSMHLVTLIRNDFFKRYIHQKYVDFVKKDQSEMISNVMNISADFGSTFISNLLIFISELFIILSLTSLLLFFNFKLTICIIIIFSFIMFFYIRYISPRLKVSGNMRIESDQRVIDYSKLSFQNIKELKIFNKENFFIKLFDENALKSENSNYFYNVSAQYPRIGMEIFAVLGIALLTILMNYFGFENEIILTTLAFFGIAIFRILPSANKLMFSFQAVRFSKNTVEVIKKEISKNHDFFDKADQKDIELKFKKNIVLRNIYYKYEKNFVIDNLNLEIKKNSFVGIKGESGSGKSTLMDLLMGLIEPNSGYLLVDNQNISKNFKNWQMKCGYVAQNIFLMNDTIAANVAFGVEKSDIDIRKVRDSLKKADLYAVVNELDKKEGTFIGENGLMFSGGQRQRLAIARALYRNPEIIFFDEATSALDNKTAINVLDSINKLKKDITIIFISHDKIIDQYCDQTINLNK